MTMEELFKLLAQHGGSIISSNDLHPDLINQAKASSRMWVDNNSLGYIWEPPIAGKMPETDEEVAMFEWCYPLEIEIPEHLKDPNYILDRIKNQPPSVVSDEKIKKEAKLFTEQHHQETDMKGAYTYSGYIAGAISMRERCHRDMVELISKMNQPIIQTNDLDIVEAFEYGYKIARQNFQHPSHEFDEPAEMLMKREFEKWQSSR